MCKPLRVLHVTMLLHLQLLRNTLISNYTWTIAKSVWCKEKYTSVFMRIHYEIYKKKLMNLIELLKWTSDVCRSNNLSLHVNVSQTS